MRTLLILRHGQAAPEGAGQDHERPLTQHGARSAERVGRVLQQKQLLPDRIISSTALRARDTAQRVAVSAGFTSAIDELDALYLAEAEAYIIAVRELAAAAQCVLIVGHNPGLEELALILTGERRSLPTAGLVVCALAITSFSELSLEVAGKMTFFSAPSEPSA